MFSGADPGFWFRGEGVQKIMFANIHHEREVPNPLWSKQAPEVVGIFDALSCYVNHLFKAF